MRVALIFVKLNLKRSMLFFQINDLNIFREKRRDIFSLQWFSHTTYSEELAQQIYLTMSKVNLEKTLIQNSIFIFILKCKELDISVFCAIIY